MCNPHNLHFISKSHHYCFHREIASCKALSLFYSASKVTASTGAAATMASSSVAFALCIVLCVCSVQSVVAARKTVDLGIYVHEFRGANGTLLPAAGTGQGNFTALGWGSFLTIDNIITSGPEYDESTVLGKFTGFAAMTTKGGLMGGGILVLEQLRFGPGSKWDGSSITFTGNLVQEGLPKGPWELIVLGGTGYFRGYTGYATSEPYPATTLAPRFVYKWNFYLKK